MTTRIACVTLSALLACCSGSGGPSNPAPSPPPPTAKADLSGVWRCVESVLVSTTSPNPQVTFLGATLVISDGQIWRLALVLLLREHLEPRLGLPLSSYVNWVDDDSVEFFVHVEYPQTRLLWGIRLVLQSNTLVGFEARSNGSVSWVNRLTFARQ